MLTLPDEYNTHFAHVRPFFSKQVWRLDFILLVGARMAPGKRTVTLVLRIMGLSLERHFQNYHRGLNRAVWSNLALSAVLMGLLESTFLRTGPVVIGMDETIERRQGQQIRAKGIYRDPVHLSKSYFVKASGLRWVRLMLLVNILWAEKIWAFPFLTILAPSECYYARCA